jgi:hypothetical protein
MRLNTIINVIVVSIAPNPLGIITDATEITIRSEPVFVDW